MPPSGCLRLRTLRRLRDRRQRGGFVSATIWESEYQRQRGGFVSATPQERLHASVEASYLRRCHSQVVTSYRNTRQRRGLVSATILNP